MDKGTQPAKEQKRAPARVGRLTKRSVEGVLPLPAPSRNYLWDDQLKGFGVMVMPTGLRSYIVQYQMGGRGAKTRRYTIGRHGSPWTAEQARDEARNVLEQIRRGVDPFEAAKSRVVDAEARRKVDEELAFSNYADVWLKRHVDDRHMRSAPSIHRTFRMDLKPWFKNKPIYKITRDDIHDMLDHVAERSEAAANTACKWLRVFFNYAADKKSAYLPVSPMLRMKLPYPEGSRTRYLKGAEIRYLWEASATLPMQFKALTRLLLLTGQRLREVAEAPWTEFDLEQAVWVIPGSRTKNKLPHLVPLSQSAIDTLLATAPRKEDRKGFVLTTTGKTPISGFSKAKTYLDDAISAAIAESYAAHGEPLGTGYDIKPWVYHDLRRTITTGLQGLGVDKAHTEAILNHVSGQPSGVTSVYHLYEYRPEKTRALNLWAAEVARIVAANDDFEIPLVREETSVQDE